jgi:hypothetical protein
MELRLVNSMRLAILALALGGCFQPSYHNGGLVCATGGTPCPDGYHCAGDNTCWQNGQDPDLGASGPADLAGTGPVDGGHIVVTTTSSGGGVNVTGAKHSVSFTVGQKTSGTASGAAHSVQVGVLRGAQAK